MTASDPATILRKARELIADKSRWCQGAYARSAAGRNVDPQSERAAAWCAIGAINHVAPTDEEEERAFGYLRDACDRLLPTFGHHISLINDCVGHDAVLRVYDFAIEMAEADREGT